VFAGGGGLGGGTRARAATCLPCTACTVPLRPNRPFPAAGVRSVSKNGTLRWPQRNRSGICGDAAGQTKWDAPGRVVKTYRAGGTISVDILFAQNHLGRVNVRLCPLDAKTERQCLTLERCARGPAGGGRRDRRGFRAARRAFLRAPACAPEAGRCAGAFLFSRRLRLAAPAPALQRSRVQRTPPPNTTPPHRRAPPPRPPRPAAPTARAPTLTSPGPRGGGASPTATPRPRAARWGARSCTSSRPSARRRAARRGPATSSGCAPGGGARRGHVGSAWAA
jgi:hypothetical protein